MATSAQQHELAAWIDQSLDYLTEEWLAVAAIASEWSTWDEPDRLDFVLEWPLREIRLQELQSWQAEGRLTSLQRNRLGELERLIQRHRPALAHLLEE